MNTNIILKKVVSNLNSNYREKFTKFLSTDIEKSMPREFTGLKYNKADDEKTLFLFIREDYKIIGILKGREFDKKNEDYMVYGKDYKYFPQNWKHLSENAKYILALTPAMRKVTIKSKNKPTTKKELRKREIEYWGNYKRHFYGNDTKALNVRLATYKKNKYNTLTHEQIMERITAITNLLTSKLFAPKEIQIEMYNKVKKVAWCSSPSVPDLLRRFADDIYNYTYKKNQLDEYIEQARTYGDGYFYNHAKTEYETQKVNIIEWYNSIV